MIGFYNYSVIVTYIGLSTAVMGISLSMRGHIWEAVICLLVCGLCDMTDGPIARRCKRTEDEKSFGIQIDSLCDLICFGAFPAAICLFSDSNSWYSIIVSAYYVLAAVIRLGFFNVQEINRVINDPGRRKAYDGLPVTSAAGLVPLFAAIDSITPVSFRGFYSIPLLIIGVLFISPFRIPKLHTKGLVVCGLIGAAVLTVIIVCGRSLNNF